MRIKSIIGDVNVERHRKRRSYIGHAVVTVTMMKDGDRENSFSLSHNLYSEVRRRNDITAKLVWETVAEMLDGRDDLEGMTIRSVRVEEVNTVWSTPYEEAYPKDEEGNRS